MASAKVTITLSPIELQILCAALGIYIYVCERYARELDNPLKGYRLDMSLGDGDPRKLVQMAQGILRNIGLK